MTPAERNVQRIKDAQKIAARIITELNLRGETSAAIDTYVQRLAVSIVVREVACDITSFKPGYVVLLRENV